MDRRRRTVPRSALRAGASLAPSPPKIHDVLHVSTPTASTPQAAHYAPQFRTTASPPDEAAALPPLRTGVEALSPVTVEPAICFGSAPQTAIHWLPPDAAQSRSAIAVSGSGDGAPGADSLVFYEVRVGAGAVNSRIARTLSHPGKVCGVTTARDACALYAASSDGRVRALAATRWSEATPTIVAELPERVSGARSREPVAAVAALRNGAALAFGADGSLVHIDGARSGTGALLQTKNTPGFLAATSLDAATAAAAVASGDVTIWDARGRIALAQTLQPPARGARAVCVASDPAQPHFVLAGALGGELAVWDRRSPAAPVVRVALHDGPVWALAVVASRPGLLLSCGEDACVWLMDFGAASGRAAMGSAADAWRDAGEHWRAQLTQSDLRGVGGLASLAVNAVAAHPMADLYAFASDAASVTFGSLYN